MSAKSGREDARGAGAPNRRIAEREGISALPEHGRRHIGVR
jgi:hypothetical protein